MHRRMTFNLDVWKPGFIKIIEFPFNAWSVISLFLFFIRLSYLNSCNQDQNRVLKTKPKALLESSSQIHGLHNNLNVDVIIRVALIFVNLKIENFNEILFVHKLLNINQLKIKQTCIEKSSFQCTSYLQLNGSYSEGIPPPHCRAALEEAASWVNLCASSVSSWSTPNDTLLSSLLLEELVVIMCSWRALDSPLCIYINLMNIWIKKFSFFFKKKNNLTTPPLY